MQRYHFSEISSTNDYAKEMLSDHDLVLITADHQSKGRGRNSNSWEGDFGRNIYMSVGINHQKIEHFKRPALYQAVGCLSVLETLKKSYPDQVFVLKYPNDVYAKVNNTFKKLSGVLIEQSYLGKKADSTIIGIGVNVYQNSFPPELEDKACSLKHLSIEADIEKLIQQIAEFINHFLNVGENKVFKEWTGKLNITNKQCEVLGKGSWVIHSLLNDGRLKLFSQKNELIIDNGDSVRYDLS